MGRRIREFTIVYDWIDSIKYLFLFPIFYLKTHLLDLKESFNKTSDLKRTKVELSWIKLHDPTLNTDLKNTVNVFNKKKDLWLNKSLLHFQSKDWLDF